MRVLTALDSYFGRLTGTQVAALASCGVAAVGVIDYLTGFEISMSLLYLGPVAVATWYARRSTGIAIAVMSCLFWYVADLTAGHTYTHPAIAVWNALIRLGFFVITSLLLGSLRDSLVTQRQLARTDGLTGLFSRRAFEEMLERDLAQARRRRSAITLAYLDLDDFKTVNDTLGHAEGDQVLRATGRVLRSAIRQTDTAARLGGDEFALILPDTDSHQAQGLVGRLFQQLQDALGVGESPSEAFLQHRGGDLLAACPVGGRRDLCSRCSHV
jgi:diguanylate cyclase (GGDEF)-like protein